MPERRTADGHLGGTGGASTEVREEGSCTEIEAPIEEAWMVTVSPAKEARSFPVRGPAFTPDPQGVPLTFLDSCS
jgi:hypothetical protein